MRIDVVIPAHNEEDRIDRTLDLYRHGDLGGSAQFLVALVGQDLRQELTNSHFVVDHQDLGHGQAALASGNSTLTDAPRLGRFSIVTAP